MGSESREDDCDVSVVFRGASIAVAQRRRTRESGGGEDPTGGVVWQSSAVLLRLLADDAFLRDALLGRAAAAAAAASTCASVPLFSQLRLLDLSAGAGLVALACAAAGARVTASETVSQLPLLRDNVARSALPVRLLELYWGNALPVATTPVDDARFDLAVASDIVFIALRDGFERELSWTLRTLATAHCRAVVFCWEERRCAQEDAFLRALAEPLAAEGPGRPGAPALDVEEVLGDAVRLPKEARLAGVGGLDESEFEALFYLPPPVRVAVLRARPGGGLAATA